MEVRINYELDGKSITTLDNLIDNREQAKQELEIPVSSRVKKSEVQDIFTGCSKKKVGKVLIKESRSKDAKLIDLNGDIIRIDVKKSVDNFNKTKSNIWPEILDEVDCKTEEDLKQEVEEQSIPEQVFLESGPTEDCEWKPFKERKGRKKPLFNKRGPAIPKNKGTEQDLFKDV